MRNLKSLRENLASRLISKVTRYTTPAPQPGNNKPKFLNKMEKRMKKMSEGKADDAFASLDKEIENKDKPMAPEPKREFKPGKTVKFKDLPDTDKEQWRRDMKAAGMRPIEEQ